MNMSADEQILHVLRFWFEESKPEQWYAKDDAFDALLGERFGEWVERALAGELDSWADTAEGSLALILLLDQMTRNIYRDTSMSFAGDDQALAVCLNSVARGDHKTLPMPQVKFLLTPMMHSEDLAIQNQSLPLFKEQGDERTYDYAIRHRDIIARFGRFPHRNAVLERPSSDEEQAFLLEPGSSF